MPPCDNKTVQPRGETGLHGPAALPWWVGFVACGLAAPLVVEVGCLVRERWRSRSGVGWDARAYPIGVPVSEPRAEASASVPSENEAAAGLLSTPSEKDGGQDGAAPEREDVTLWSN